MFTHVHPCSPMFTHVHPCSPMFTHVHPQSLCVLVQQTVCLCVTVWQCDSVCVWLCVVVWMWLCVCVTVDESEWEWMRRKESYDSVGWCDRRIRGWWEMRDGWWEMIGVEWWEVMGEWWMCDGCVMNEWWMSDEWEVGEWWKSQKRNSSTRGSQVVTYPSTRLAWGGLTSRSGTRSGANRLVWPELLTYPLNTSYTSRPPPPTHTQQTHHSRPILTPQCTKTPKNTRYSKNTIRISSDLP